jgi:proline dehydrogenase
VLDSASKILFHLIAQSGTLKKLASRYGLRRPSSFARRFIAGETVEEAIAAARALEARGMLISLDLLGESVTSLAAASAATRGYLEVIDAIIASGIERNISLKLTQLGLDVDRACTVDNLRKILETAGPAGFFVRIDMENSPYTEVTLDIFETLWGHGYTQLGVVLQSMLYRSEQDLVRVNALGARIRLVKGAYKESKAVAYPDKADVDAAYERMMKALLTDARYPAIATHDPKMIASAREWARAHDIAPDRFEFQMLYGVRRDLQAMLIKAGYRVRVYIPFGREWFPYFMRRLGERPANVMFVIRGILRDRG